MTIIQDWNYLLFLSNYYNVILFLFYTLKIYFFINFYFTSEALVTVFYFQTIFQFSKYWNQEGTNFHFFPSLTVFIFKFNFNFNFNLTFNFVFHTYAWLSLGLCTYNFAGWARTRQEWQVRTGRRLYGLVYSYYQQWNNGISFFSSFARQMSQVGNERQREEQSKEEIER